MGDTSIEWTDKTWNPVRGCSRVSDGCRNCYAERTAARFCGPGQPYEGLAVQRPGSKWTGEVRLVRERLSDPLRWRIPRRVFVNSMSDLFHEKLSNEDIAAVFGVMVKAFWHTFQVLTKRPGRASEWYRWAAGGRNVWPEAQRHAWPAHAMRMVNDGAHRPTWPPSNVWLGVSVEDQETADERIPLLLETSAAIRFVSYEPALGPVDLHAIQMPNATAGLRFSSLKAHHDDRFGSSDVLLDWVIVGAESGPSARPADIEWFRRVKSQCCDSAGTAFFAKQMVVDGKLCKNVAKFPEDLRVRQWPRGKKERDGDE